MCLLLAFERSGEVFQDKIFSALESGAATSDNPPKITSVMRL